jgi:glycosidase
LRSHNKALAANAGFTKLATSNDDALYAFERYNEGHRVLVIVNLSGKAQAISWVKRPRLTKGRNVFTGRTEMIRSLTSLPAWGYIVEEGND